MRQDSKKRHIICLRVSSEEWDSLQEIMKGLQLKRVSDLMREGFKQLLVPTDALQEAIAEGEKRAS